MNGSDFEIILNALMLTGLLGWYIFGPERSRRAGMCDGVQVVGVTVEDGYQPEILKVTAADIPVTTLFDRQESGDCSSRVLISDFHVNHGTQHVDLGLGG